MPIIHKSEQSTLGSPVNLRDITTKIYDLDEIKNYQLDEAINNHPLVKRPTAIRSKLAYKEIIHNTKPTKKGYRYIRWTATDTSGYDNYIQFTLSAIDIYGYLSSYSIKMRKNSSRLQQLKSICCFCCIFIATS